MQASRALQATQAHNSEIQTGSETGFIISSFITGLIFFIAVCGIALVYARFRGKKEDEEDEVEDEKAVDDEDLGKLEDT